MAALLWCALVALTASLLQQGNGDGPAATAPRVIRAVFSEQIQKWENGTIYYTFDSSVSIRIRNIIRDAMDEWEDYTCVIFKAERNERPNFVEFYSRPNEEYCTCDSLGDRGGKQLIKLGYSCQEKGEILHLLGHILGFWHEQARPDRDVFVQINFANIAKGQEANFDKLPYNSSIDTVDQIIGYDYSSIMHLKPTAFSINGTDTTEVTNEIEYDHQGRPKVGQHIKISEKDIQNTNIYYGCPSDNNNMTGILQVNVMNAKSLPESTDPTVLLTVMKSNGDNKIISTLFSGNNVRDPIWNVHFRIPIDGSTSFPWQNIRLKIIGKQNDIPVPISMSETIRIVPDQHTLLKHCIDPECSGYLMYNYEFLSDRSECDPNPCIHGECIDGFVDYTCSCPPGYDGKNCSQDISGDSCQSNPCAVTGTQQCTDRFFDYTCLCKVGYTGKECNTDVCTTHVCQNNGTCIHHDNSRGYQCTCRPGYQGVNCQTHVCLTQPCQNGGTCLAHDGTNGYQCNCRSGYHGTFCNINVCSSQPCHNNGTCEHYDNFRGYQCYCQIGYQGEICQTHVCSTQPCQNGGTCSYHSTHGYQCSCRPGYQGVNCNIDVCLFNPCQNGGTCAHYPNSRGYICNCRPGYQGTTCNINVCSSRPCQNGGTCVHYSNSQGYQCYCRPGYQGEICQTHVCSTQPCQNGGTCSHHNFRGYQCSCRPGYQGEICQTHVCSTRPCQNGGTCSHHSTHGYQCSCRPGYQGENCQTHVCSGTQPCQNGGTCSHHSSRGYQCSCRPGYQGVNCQTHVCSTRPCQNRGTCSHHSTRGYQCSCRPGYQGVNCQTHVCSTRPCQNGGTCSHHSTRGYQCSCRPGYQGENCNINVCSRNPCRNGGTCVHTSANSREYICNCRPGYQGTFCSINVCTSQPCQNGGTCVHSSNSRGYVCTCTTRYSGNNCQTDLCVCNSGTCFSYTSSTSFSCSCLSGYCGSRCEKRDCNLRVYARDGHNLPDADGWLAGPSDPYFIAVAYDRNGNSQSRNTRHDQGNPNPIWNTWLYFGVDDWNRFTVRIYDNDGRNDDALSRWYTYYPKPGCHYNNKICGNNGCGGYVHFNYCYT